MHYEFSTSRKQYLCNVLVMYIDCKDDRADQNYRYLRDRLKSEVVDVFFYVSADECVDDLTDITDRTLFLIASEDFAQLLITKINSVTHLINIYIYRSNASYTSQWFRQWAKIRNAYTTLTQLADELELDIRNSKHDSMPIALIPAEKNIDCLENNFILTLLLLRIFKQINLHIYSREFSEELIRRYLSGNSIYQMVNKSLRDLDMNQLFQMHNYLSNLSHAIEEIDKEQRTTKQRNSQIMKVYRGQRLQMSDFQQLCKRKDNLISFNSFLSTSRKRDLALTVASSAATTSDSYGILFDITIDTSFDSICFAEITKTNDDFVESEILFPMHAVFRVSQLNVIDKQNRIFEVILTRSSSDIDMIDALFQRCELELQDNQVWDRLRALDVDVSTQFINLSKQIIYQLINIPRNDTIDVNVQQQLSTMATILKKFLPDKYEELAPLFGNLGVLEKKKKRITQPKFPDVHGKMPNSN